MTSSIAGVPIPDTRLAADATELVRADAPPLLFHHSRRVYLFGMLQGRRLGLAPDPELLYVGAMFHDLGLTDKYRTKDQRFEVVLEHFSPGVRRTDFVEVIESNPWPE